MELNCLDVAILCGNYAAAYYIFIIQFPQCKCKSNSIKGITSLAKAKIIKIIRQMLTKYL